MVKNKFSLYEAFNYGFKVIFNNFVFFLGAILLSVLAWFFILLLLGVASYPTLGDAVQHNVSGTISLICVDGLLGMLFSVVLAVGWIKIALDLQENKQVRYNYLYKFYYFAPRVMAVTVLRYLVTMLGCCFFLIPGIFIFQRLRFAKYYVIDKDQSVMQAWKSSWNLTKGSVIHLVGYSILDFFMGAIIPFLPLSSQVEAHIYRQMLHENPDRDMVA